MGRKQIVWFCPICNYEAEAYPDSPPPICPRCLLLHNRTEKLLPEKK
ncbi:MAG: hypothetical protein N0A00_01375 [Candidatus Bathyarchaeota archaeon]|nr:hypothetical protein [Candidatus Bathyarchaeota archaeon]